MTDPDGGTIPGIPVGALMPFRRFDWERLIRRVRLGFYEGKTKDPRRWVSHKTVQQVALLLMTYADQDGTRVMPSAARVALVGDLDERTVRICVGRLRSLGLLELVRAHRSPGRNGGSGRAAEYRMTCPDDLWLRVAHLDPDEQELIVPEGVDLAPPRRARPKKADPEGLWTTGPDGPVDDPGSPRE